MQHLQEEMIYMLKEEFNVRVRGEMFYLNEGDFAHLPSKVHQTFLNLTG